MTPIPLVVAADASSVAPPVEIAPAAAMLSQIEARCERARANHLGYPYNLAFEPLPPAFAGYLVNNLGDPYAGSHYASEVCDLERDVVRWLMGLWQASDEREFWGSVGTSGTEGNFWAIYLGREFLPGAVLLHS
ncbi:hypothetical protein WDZ92_15435, partial [Nostoc sp. NIES-2111]